MTATPPTPENPATPATPATPAATLRLERGMSPAPWDRTRTWPVLLDGRTIGHIALGEVFETKIAPGPHTLQLASRGRRRSPARHFTAAAGSVTEYACHVQPVWPLALMALALPGRWIALRRR